jgi:serine/threonine protein kinase
MTQELVAGSDLRKLLKGSDRLSLCRVLNIAWQICDGLANAHSIPHRDIKPGNIMVDNEDRTKITDFGLVPNCINLRIFSSGPSDGQRPWSIRTALPFGCRL